MTKRLHAWVEQGVWLLAFNAGGISAVRLSGFINSASADLIALCADRQSKSGREPISDALSVLVF